MDFKFIGCREDVPIYRKNKMNTYNYICIGKCNGKQECVVECMHTNRIRTVPW